ncbi:hypothetical protein HDIA_2239 [Hartmannibacter diazotrophicus]|uniref:Transcriptional regulator n=1 Tax=Hartmannibacter diazotrophicus TaxID=1482074 RepID=A0A2C9D6G6_9HYPH|nr:transcriptional regulator [Hartmannibacter diazotrophicus]SON55780.1 hypothetical protein HDIA_2239 [Hartmannibacter diazotrophicus]
MGAVTLSGAAAAASDKDYVAIARSCWGDSLPDWIEALASECNRIGQRSAAEKIDYSGSAVSAVLRRKYQGNVAEVEARTRAALMRGTVLCPSLQRAISGAQCLANQALPFSTANPARARLFRDCRNGCLHSRIGGDA